MMLLTAASSLLGPDGPRHKGDAGFLPESAISRLPAAPARYQMNRSTIIMPCNNSGYMDPVRTKAWSIIDFDWSNGKAIWTKQRPMRDEAVLQNQVVMSTKASLGQTVSATSLPAFRAASFTRCPERARDLRCGSTAAPCGPIRGTPA